MIYLLRICLTINSKCAAFFDQIFPWSFWSIDQLDGPLHFCLLSCCVLPVVLRCVVLRFAVCCVLVFSLLCCVVLCCDLLCVLFLSSPCCVALCCVAICYCIRLTFFYYHLPSFQHRTEQLDRQTTASPARRARPTPRNAGRSTSSTVLCISVLSFVMLCSSSCVALRCVVLRFAVCCVLVFSLLCCVVLCCDLLCVLFLSSPCCVALCCVAICYCIRLTFFYYHLPSFQHRTEQLDRQTMASPARRARPTPQL